MPCLTPNMRTVLARATERDATFSAAEIALIEPLATAVAPTKPAADRDIRQALGALAAALPAQALDEAGGRLKLATYLTMLRGCDADALAYACRRCLAELDWFPTVRQILDRVRTYVSPEQHAINVARYILANGRREPESDVAPMTDDEVRRMSPEMRRLGMACGALTAEQVARATAGMDEGAADDGERLVRPRRAA